MAKEKIDFEAEGLLEGLEGKARDARLALLTELAEDGVSVDELRDAVEQDHLALLPVDRVLAGEGGRYSPEEVSRRTGMPIEMLARQRQSLGLPVPDPQEVALTDEDVEAVERLRAFQEAGLSEEAISEIGRVIGVAMAQVADANRAMIGETFMQKGDTELDLAMRYAEAARALIPMVGPTLQYVFNVHLRETVRQTVVSAAEMDSGRLPGSQEIAVSFADLVGFTKLGERLEIGEIGELSGRLSELARAAAQPPVRLVKLIGDAAMLVATEPDPLLEATMSLVEAAKDSDEMPSLRAGVAHGPALARGGDWYGRPVNLASRITGYARPDSVLGTDEVAERAGEAFRFSKAGRRHFKGIKGLVELRRVRRASDSRWRRG